MTVVTRLPRPVVVGGLMALFATATHALELSVGAYTTRQDGGVGLLVIEDGQARLGISGRGCVGALAGPLRRNTDGTLSFRQTMGSASCELTLDESSEGLAWIAPGQGCSFFHGASCSFAGVVVERTVPRSMSAIDEGFQQLDATARLEVQAALQASGHYRGAIDGIAGPGTRGAIIQAAEAAMARGDHVSLDKAHDVQAFLLGLSETEPTTQADFFGTWNCEGSTYTFGEDGYQNIPDRAPLPYREIKEFTPGNFGVTFVDGYRLGLMDVTGRSMIWSSPASGDVFECSKDASVSGQVPGGDIIASYPAGEVEPASADTPFLGPWDCTSDGMGAVKFEFAPTATIVEAMGVTLAYENVIAAGSRGTAFRFEYTDGDMAHVFEADGSDMLLYAFGDVFECTAE
ncbi:MAG: peptidoglycan-binding domain-containing protein [Pseudomonadota bacterium]